VYAGVAAESGRNDHAVQRMASMRFGVRGVHAGRGRPQSGRQSPRHGGERFSAGAVARPGNALA